MRRGSCLCGTVSFEIHGELQPAIACHCMECRKQSGHYGAASGVKAETVTMVREAGLAWYRTSDFATRGFCRDCGSTLFWKRDNSPLIHILLGAIDGPSGVQLARHFWISEKGDYYEIADGLPQLEED